MRRCIWHLLPLRQRFSVPRPCILPVKQGERSNRWLASQGTTRPNSTLENKILSTEDSADYGQANVVSSQESSSRSPQSARSEDETPKVDEIASEQPLNLDDRCFISEEIEQNDDTTPWYLQVPSPAKIDPSILERQAIPEIPADAPTLLKPILEHLSLVVGLDDLSLLDLRQLDPPPALGSELIMIIGTARSERHLHVAADRFAKWLRNEHRLTPNADGLLGQGQLKIRLRRKAKRARLLSRTGAVETSEYDDGLSTGWICVSVGNLSQPVVTNADADFIGFKDDLSMATVVVQMMTMQKREDLELEKLWRDAMQRQERKLTRLMEPEPLPLQPRLLGPQAQHRYYSTFASRANMSMNGAAVVLQAGPNATMKERQFAGASIADHFLQQGDDRQADIGSRQSTKSQNYWTERDIRGLVEELRQKTPKTRLESAAAFWKAFDENLDLFPSVEDAEHRLEAYSLFHEGGHVAAQLEALAFFHEMEADYLDLPQSAYLAALRLFLAPPVHGTIENRIKMLREATGLVEQMAARGHDVHAETLSAYFETALRTIPIKQAERYGLRNDALARLERLLPLSRVPSDDFASENIERMEICASRGRWDEFWQNWRRFAQFMEPRSKSVYLALLNILASRASSADIYRCLRTCIAEMPAEEPPILLDAEIAAAIRRCIVIADPHIAAYAASPDAFGEWVNLWRRCAAVEESLQDNSQAS